MVCTDEHNNVHDILDIYVNWLFHNGLLLLDMYFRNWDIFGDDLLRLISRSQAEGSRKEAGGEQWNTVNNQ